MMIEVLGIRLIGPVFGVGLFVWAALLTVTLSSLAAGYYCGGVLADRFPTPRLPGTALTVSGVTLGLLPLLSIEVLKVAESTGPRTGPLLSAAFLFGPSLILLGTVSPIAVRLATTDLHATGRRVGGIYAVSTAGSVVGTLLTAFVLVPAFETDRLLVGIALSLVVMGGLSLARLGRPGWLVAASAPLLALAASPHRSLPTGFNLVDRAQSPYGLVEVIDDTARGVRLFRAEHSVIGAEWSRDHTSAFAFTHLLEAVRFVRPRANDVLQVGLGSGALPSVLAKRGLVSDVVEIDPAVVRFAGSHFGFKTAGLIYVEDARAFLRQTSRQYDVIVHDTFTGGTTPEHLLSEEAIESVRNLLRPGVLLALNFAGYQRGTNAEPGRAVLRTLRAAFRNVRVFRDMDPRETPDGAANLIYFASDDSMDFAVPGDAWFENEVCRHVLGSFAHWEIHLPEDGELITDARNPLGRMQIPVFEEHFEDMRKMLPVDVWLR